MIKPGTIYRYAKAGFKLGYPLQVGFAVNNTCNTYCQMCNIWQMQPKQALSIDEIKRVFSNRLFKNCYSVSLTGGEPFVRTDIVELMTTLRSVMPSLQKLNITTNGFDHQRIKDNLYTVVPDLHKNGVGVGVNMSMDGVGNVHDLIRNREGAFSNLEKTIDNLIELGKMCPSFNPVLAVTLSKNNCHDAENILDYAKKKNIYAIFRNAFTIKRIDNLENFDDFSLSSEQLEKLNTLYQKLLDDYDKSYTRRIYYKMLLQMMSGASRSVPCLYRKASLFIDHKANMYVCTVFSDKIGNALEDDLEVKYFKSIKHRQELKNNACKKCSHDVTLYLPLHLQVLNTVYAEMTGVQR